MKHDFEMMKLKHQMRQRKQEKLYEPKPFGSALRFSRIEKNMTLQEAAEGICSVSYLSKAENNLIAVSEQFVEPLSERLGIERYDDKDDSGYKIDRDMIVDHLIMRTSLPDDMLASYGKRKDHQAELIRFGYYMAKHDFVEALIHFHHVRNYLLRLDDFEMNLFVYLMHVFLFRQERFDEAHESIMLLSKEGLTDPRMHILAIEGRLLCAYRMHMITEVMELYPKYMKLVVEQQVYHRVKEIEKQNMLFEAYYRDPKEIEERVARMSQIEGSDKDLIVAYAHAFHQNYERVIECAKPYYHDDEAWLMIYLYALDHVQDEETIRSLIFGYEGKNDFLRKNQYFMRHLKYKYTADKDQILHYLRQEILGVHELTDDYVILNYLMLDAQSLFSKYNHYKDAIGVMNKFLPKIRRMQKMY
jgi:HTH-type transcriptional regulator, quorum sensing regulator NprR